MTKNIYWKYMHNHNRTKAAQRQPWMQILQMFYVFPFLQVHLLRKQFIGCDVSNICVFLRWRVKKSCSWSHKFIFSLFYLFAFTLALLPFSIHLHWIAFSLFFFACFNIFYTFIAMIFRFSFFRRVAVVRWLNLCLWFSTWKILFENYQFYFEFCVTFWHYFRVKYFNKMAKCCKNLEK